jgi:hypothetical protein
MWEHKGGAFVSDSTNAQFTQEEVLEMAQGNATAFVLTTFAYLKERGLDPDEYVAFSDARLHPAGKICVADRSRKSHGWQR